MLVFYKLFFIEKINFVKNTKDLESFVFIGDSGLGNDLQRKVSQKINNYCKNLN